jgi:predicted DNA-binding protein
MRESDTEKLTSKVIREHYVNFYASYELKERLKVLARKYDRTMADMARAVLKIGIPMMEAITVAEEAIMKEYLEQFQKLRKVRTLKDI